jgi:hypothetical protein
MKAGVVHTHHQGEEIRAPQEGAVSGRAWACPALLALFAFNPSEVAGVRKTRRHQYRPAWPIRRRHDTYTTAAGGLIFSVGSVSFGGSLIIDSALQTIVRNVLDECLGKI